MPTPDPRDVSKNANSGGKVFANDDQDEDISQNSPAHQLEHLRQLRKSISILPTFCTRTIEVPLQKKNNTKNIMKTTKTSSAIGIAAILVIAALLATTVTFGVLLEKEKDTDDDENTTQKNEKARPQAMTLWWVFFNNPENCINDPDAEIKCGPLDVFGAAFLESQEAGVTDLSLITVNTDSGFAMLYATGGISDEKGQFRLPASIYVSPDETLNLPLSMDPMVTGVGLTNPNAEVHAIVRSHGDYVVILCYPKRIE